MPDIYQQHIDVALSNFALRYRNNTMIADIIFPRVDVGQPSGFFWVFGRESLQGGDKDDTRAPGAPAIETTRTMSKTQYFTPDHARKSPPIPNEEIGISDLTDPVQDAARINQDQILLGHEIRTAALVFAQATYAASNRVALTGTDQWSDPGSDPVKDIQVGIEAGVLFGTKLPNVLVLGRKTATSLFAHAGIKASLSDAKNRAVTITDLEQIFQIPQILVGDAVKRSDAGVNSFVWGKHAALLYVEPNANFQSVSFGKTFNWSLAPGSTNGTMVKRWDEPDRSTNAQRTSNHWRHDEQVTAADTGYFIENAVA